MSMYFALWSADVVRHVLNALSAASTDRSTSSGPAIGTSDATTEPSHGFMTLCVLPLFASTNLYRLEYLQEKMSHSYTLLSMKNFLGESCRDMIIS